MLSVTGIYQQYGDRVLFNHVSFVIMPRDKVGLVGRNGAGKSTMLKIIAGDRGSDQGTVTRPTGSTLGFLHQEMDLPSGRSVMQETLTAFAHIQAMEERLAAMTKEMETRTDYETDEYAAFLEEFTSLTERFAMVGGITMEAEAERVLKGLGFQQADFGRQTTEFSGGWQMRIELAKMLLQRPDYLLLDEPTNHLDIESIIWLENWLSTYSGAVVTISHDKQFLDNVTNRTLEIELGKVYDYKAGYSKYVELQADRREKAEAAFENQQKVIADKERTINRFMAKATKTKMAQSMQKQLDKIERIELDQTDTAVMNLRFAKAPRSGAIALQARNITKTYGKLNVLRGVDLKIDRGDRVAFVGQNGQGKTTLAKILINNIPATSGEVEMGHNVSVGYYAQNQSDALDGKKTLLETMEEASPPEMRTRLRAILGAFLFTGEDAEKKVSVLSGGERARLALACMLLRPFNLLVLDEPTNHLDMISKDRLKQAVLDYDGTLVVVSHDREFLAGLTDRTIEFRDHQLHEHLGDVNFFLEKRKIDNMRAVELEKSKADLPTAPAAPPAGGLGGTTAPAPAAAPKLPALSPEERRRLEKDIGNAERKIERLEKEIEKIHQVMADPDFYNNASLVSKTTNELKAKQDELDAAMEAWEQASEALGA
ncbi:ABC-F family ATP-binding cassette domain-containing protein [Neolewinella lacunae]|uniref:ABC-F family ATP-binding cassette domain-containing protein n=1 Tax=Neolewinella lacunae TaxID=1517758 RepID=A0A923T8E6_9BACT|nr:ABC-F family ATP-binding cassette domain-containing protein [Neolewinella lacunae]MBC6993868.1 ABC-F family ATP-binding cassette domain-containing protein [Neolewinella lacunae]MDN3637071.1 ABC-F family ATP-binding cassette domain-containing protein [Neolewinella lacunae]